MFDNSQFFSGGAAGFYDFPLGQSLRFNDDDTAYLSGSSASTLSTYTMSLWLKRGVITSGTYQYVFSYANSGLAIGSTVGNTDKFYVYNGSTVTPTDGVYRDPSAWYHLVLSVTSNTGVLYINGESVKTGIPCASIGTTANYFHIGGYQATGNFYFDGYLAEVNFIDGTALDASSFGELKSGVWIPKNPSGLAYGTNGFRLRFAGNANDSSGKGNNFTANNLSSYDYVPDSPTNNFATLNPLWTYNSANSGTTYSQGNLQYAMTSSNSRGAATMEVLADGCYFEMMARSSTCAIGVQSLDGSTTHTWNAVNSGELSNIGGTDPDGFTTGDVVAVAVGTDGNIKLYKNGTLQGSDNTLTGHTAGTPLVPLLGEFATAASNTIIANFGQDSTFTGFTTAGGNSDANGYGDFKYSVPSGYLALSTANLPEPTISPADDASPKDHFNILGWQGRSSAGTSSYTGLGFQPDFTWIKCRGTAHHHYLVDVLRGPDNVLSSNLIAAEPAFTPDEFVSFDSDGITVEFIVGGGRTNYSAGGPYIAWNWKANGSGVSNTDGSATTTVSANTDSGFSIVTFTKGSGSESFGHGLGKKPDMIILRTRNAVSQWWVWHTGLSNEQQSFIQLNNTTGAGANTSAWDNQAPTDEVFYQREYILSNTNTGIAYCFNSVEGFSSFGSYTGNGLADGPFVYTGFRPAFVMTKRTNSTNNWITVDTTRSPENVNDNILYANLGNAEVANETIDFDLVSNGFKLRSGGAGNNNTSGSSYIYMAFAENPFKYSNAR